MTEIQASAATRPTVAPVRLWLALTAIYSALTLVALDGAIVNVALPTIARTLHVSSAASVAVATSYQLAVVISLLPFAALGESFGPRKVFVGGAALFIAASALCAMSTSLPMLVAARFAQGLGGGGDHGDHRDAAALHRAEGAARRRRSAGTRWRWRSPARRGLRSAR